MSNSWNKAVGGTVTNIYMNMNGTWVDVTGRVKWIDRSGEIVDINPERLDTSGEATGSGTLFMEIKNFIARGGGRDGGVPGLFSVSSAPAGFNELWAPHHSRLIAITKTQQPIIFVNATTIDQLKTEPITFHIVVNSRLESAAGSWDSSAVDDEIKQVQMELTEDGYLYNTSLSDDQMFVMDSFGVEVFIEPRN